MDAEDPNESLDSSPTMAISTKNVKADELKAPQFVKIDFFEK